MTPTPRDHADRAQERAADDVVSDDELVALEVEGWQALTTEGAAGPFYDRLLDEAPVMLLPGGMVLTDRAEMVASMSGTPWRTFELHDVRVQRPSDDVGVVTYRAEAVRDERSYVALMSSVYVRRGGDGPDRWRLVLHQQTPAG